MSAVLANESELYLTPGWPAIRLIQSIGARRKKESQSLPRRIVALVLVTWVPMCLFAVLQGQALGSVPSESFLLDFAVYARLCVGLPILVASDVIIGTRLRTAGLHFVHGDFIRTEDIPAFERAVTRLARLRESIAATVVLVCLAALTANAQVNAEALRSSLQKTPRFLWLEGGLVGRTGNTETMTFSGSAFGGITSEPHLLFSRLSADYGQARGETNVARWMGHARYNYRFTDAVAGEALTQVQHDRFRRLAIRDLYGVGLRFEAHREDDLEVFLGTTYLFEHEVIDAVPGSPQYDNVWHRSSNYGGFNLRVAPVVDMSSVTYAQPRIDRPLDFRVLSETLVSFTISKVLAARVSASVWYDNRPPFGVRSYDAEIKNSLVVKLQ